MTYAKIRSFALALSIAAVILVAIFSFPIVTHADRDIVDSSCLKHRLFGWLGATVCELDQDPTNWAQYVCISGYADYIGALGNQADIANLNKPSVVNCIKDVEARQRAEGKEVISPQSWGMYLLTPAEASTVQARLDSQQARLNQERQEWEQDIDRTLANPSTLTQKAVDYPKTPEKYTVDKTSEASSADSETRVFYRNSAGQIVSGHLPEAITKPRAILRVNDDGTVVYAPQSKAQTPSLRLSELPDSAYAPLPKTTARQATECLQAYEDGEMTYEEFIACVPEPKKADIPSSDVNVQTIRGLPAQRIEEDEISSTMDLDSAEDSREWNTWSLNRNSAAERANLEGGVSAGLGSSFLNFFSRQQRDEPQTPSRSFLSGWDPVGQIKSLLGIEPEATFKQPYNPDLESWRGIKLDDNPQTLDALAELESQQGPELAPPAPQHEPVQEDTRYFTPGPYDQRAYFSEGDDYEEIYRNPLLTY